MKLQLPKLETGKYISLRVATFLVLMLGISGVGIAQTPKLSSPAKLATNLEASFTISIGTKTGATTYNIDLSKNATYTGSYPNLQKKATNATRTYTVKGLTYGMTYNLRWKASNSAYQTTTLTVKPSPITYANIVDGVTMPNAVTLIQPILQHGVTTFYWEFDVVNTFNSPSKVTATTLLSSNTGAYSYNPANFLPNQLYYVRVKGYVTYQNLMGAWSTGANIKTFNTSLAETYASNIVDGSYLDVQSMDIIPLALGGGITSYDWEFDTTASFNSAALISANTLVSTNSGAYAYDANNFLSGTLYYVRARGLTASVTGPWSSGLNIKSFYSALHLAVISSPSNAYLANRNSLKLECFVVDKAASYEIQYSTDPGFAGATTVIPNRDFYNPGGWNPVGVIVVKSYDYVSGLIFNTDYYVRARAYNTNQASTWGASSTFNTGFPSIAITNPANGATNVQTTFTFSLTPGVWVQNFAVERSLTADFSSSVIHTSTNSKVKVTGMSNGISTYYARARVQVGGIWYTSCIAPISFTTCTACRQSSSVYNSPIEQEQMGEGQMYVYPNPSTDKFMLVNDGEENLTVQVTDLSGHILEEYVGQEALISLGTELFPGTYLLIIKDTNGNIESKKVVKF